MSIGERIKARREKLGLSQEELAHRIGYKSKSSINKIELDVQQLRQSKIKQVADALETTTDYIMGWSENAETRERRSEDEETLISSYRELNPANKKKSVTYTKNLLSTQQMEEELLAAHARTDVEATPEGVQNDLDIMDDDRLWD